MKRLTGVGISLLFMAVLILIVAAFTFRQAIFTSTPYSLKGAETSTLPNETATPLPGTDVVSPLPTPVATIDPELQGYSFDEPRTVITHKSLILLGDWLPNSQDISVLLNDAVSPGLEQIQTFDVTKGQLRSFGNRQSMFIARRPIWLSDIGKMAFMGANLPGKDGIAAPTHLWITGPGATDLSLPAVENITAAAGSGNLVLVTKRGQSQPSLIDAATGEQRIVPVDLKSYGIDVDGLYLQMVWHPQLRRIAIFDPHNFLVLDLDSNHVDAFDLGYDNDEYHGAGPRWAFDARWSPDGQYLALITTQGTPILPYAELSVLDVATHEMVNHDLGHRYVTDVTWSPDSKILLTATVVDNAEGKNHLGLFLVNFVGGTHRRVLPDTPITGGQFGFGLNWSPNGEIVAIYCPTSDEGRVCTMNVQAPQR
ncbi:MAG TPA: hypothetical protein GYA08_14575 [Chloroflexi bacterium]|nr:hypothetical protein [Chloroflexota bacterium]